MAIEGHRGRWGGRHARVIREEPESLRVTGRTVKKEEGPGKGVAGRGEGRKEAAVWPGFPDRGSLSLSITPAYPLEKHSFATAQIEIVHTPPPLIVGY